MKNIAICMATITTIAGEKETKCFSVVSQDSFRQHKILIHYTEMHPSLKSKLESHLAFLLIWLIINQLKALVVIALWMLMKVCF